MRGDPLVDAVVERLKPGLTIKDGFLGDDARDLYEIIDADAEVVAEMGLSHAGLAARMEFLARRGMKAHGGPVVYRQDIQITTDEVCGYVTCPWGCCGAFRKGVTTLHNQRSDFWVSYSALSIHMVREHHFFQGKGSSFRLDPYLLRWVLW